MVPSQVSWQKLVSGIGHRLQEILEELIVQLEAEPGGDIIDRDLIQLWGEEKRLITGTDLLGYLLRGIARGSH